MSHDVTPQSTKIRNQIRQGNPAEMVIVWKDTKLTFCNVYYKDGLRRDAVVRFSSDNDTLRVHYDEGTSQFAGVDLADGRQTLLSAQAVEENRIILSG